MTHIQRRTRCDPGGRDWSIMVTSQGMPAAAKIWKNGFSPPLSEVSFGPMLLVLDLWPVELWKNKFLLFWTSWYVVICYSNIEVLCGHPSSLCVWGLLSSPSTHSRGLLGPFLGAWLLTPTAVLAGSWRSCSTGSRQSSPHPHTPVLSYQPSLWPGADVSRLSTLLLEETDSLSKRWGRVQSRRDWWLPFPACFLALRVPVSVHPRLTSLIAQGQGLSETILLSAPGTKEKPNALLRSDPYGGGKARPSDRIIA